MTPDQLPTPKQGTQPNKASSLSPAQKANMKRIEDRMEGRNSFKLTKEPETGKLVPLASETGMAILQGIEASGMVDQDAALRLINQVINAQHEPGDIKNANAAIAMLQGINPQDELEGMLAGQMVAVHNMSMEFSRRALLSNIASEAADRYINRASKLMGLFTRQAEALQRYRTKGQQKIVVQHVQVGEGGQAIIGDVHQGDARD